MYYKIKIKKYRDKKDDSITHYEYEDLDSLKFRESYMTKDEKYLICSIDDDMPLHIEKITKQEYEKIKEADTGKVKNEF